MKLSKYYSKYKTQLSNRLVDLFIVVIGISIAFFIEQRSKSNEIYETRKQYLNSILSDIDKDIDAFSRTQIPFNTYKSEELDEILKAVEQGELTDPILGKMESAFVSVNATLQNSAFESIKQSGNLNDLGDINMVNAVVGYYGNKNTIDDIKTMNLEHLNKLTDYCASKAELSITKDQYGLVRIKIPKSLTQDFRLKNLLKRWLIIIDYKIGEYKRVNEDAKNLKIKITDKLSSM